MQWFRMYAEFASDPKVQSMDEVLQRRFVMLLCLQCSGDLVKLDETELAFHLRVSPEEMKRTLEIFRQKGFVGENNEILNWNKRQYKSDFSTPRVKRFREKKKRRETVSVTPSDTDTDTDTEKNKSAGTKIAPLVLHASLPPESWSEWIAHRREKRLSMSPRALNKQLKLLAEYPTAIQREIIDTSINAGWEGLFKPKGRAEKSQGKSEWM